ncbi:MAG: mechanosensitive ion channel domain-containing protein, partial [Deltaproteobacteria bacterium]
FDARAGAIVLWAYVLLRDVAEKEQYADAARAVIQFPVAALLGLLLVRIGALIRFGARDIADDEAVHDYRRTLLRNLGLATMVVAIIATAATALGYISVPAFVLVPVIWTLGLIGMLVVLQRFATSLYCLVFRRDDDQARNDLAPVLIGLLLAVTSIPVFALIWGARRSDLSETWTRFLSGVSFGSTHISPTDFLTLALVFGIGYVLTRVIQGTLRATVLPKTRIDPGGQNAIVSGLGYIGIFLSALMAITTTGIDLSSLAIVAGALSVGIGFGLQNIVSNFVAGIIMLIERPVAIGDWIEVGPHSGIVRDISVRSTRIETFDKTDVIVPNGDFIAGAVTNWTRYTHLGRVILPVKVAHGNDSRKVEQILMEIAEGHPGVSGRHKPNVALVSIDDAMKFEIRVIIKDVNQLLNVRSDMAHEVLRRFAEADLVAPIPQSEVFLHDRRAPRHEPEPETPPANPKRAPRAPKA